MPKPKRVGPPDVAPVTIRGIRYEVLPWGRDRGLGQNGGHVVARDAATGRELWTVRVYPVQYVPGLEDDVQDVFIRSLVHDGEGGGLVVADERGRTFLLDLVTRAVRPLP